MLDKFISWQTSGDISVFLVCADLRAVVATHIVTGDRDKKPGSPHGAHQTLHICLPRLVRVHIVMVAFILIRAPPIQK